MALRALQHGPRSCLDFLRVLKDAEPWRPFTLLFPVLIGRPEVLRHPFDAFGGILGTFELARALTPTLTEVRLFVLPDCLVALSYDIALSRESRLGRLVAVQFTPTGALPAGTTSDCSSDA